MATVASPATGRVTAGFAALAKHYGVGVDLCPSRHGNRKGTVEKANHSVAQRWWRTVADTATVAAAQAGLDGFCARVTDTRARRRDGQPTTVAALAQLETLGPLPPPFPVTLSVTRLVSAQALVAFAGNQYSVGPGLAGTTVTVSHRLGQPGLDIATPSGTVIARHHRHPDGAGALVRDTGHVQELTTAVLAAFTTGRPCAGKVRRPPSPAAQAEADRLRPSPARKPSPDTGSPPEGHANPDVVVDLTVWAQAARTRQVAP